MDRQRQRDGNRRRKRRREEGRGCQGEMTEQQDENGPVCALCVCVLVLREKHTAEVCRHCRCRHCSSTVGQQASVSDPIGSG